jgi:PAT family beta-lactamase induction signal transducer AmpG
LVDRFGTFRAWTIAGLIGIAALVACTPSWSEYAFPLLFCVAIFGGMQDVGLDGWIVAAVPPEHQGRAAGVRTAAYRGAMALCGGGAVWVGARYGWNLGWYVVAAAVGISALAVLQLPAPPRPAVHPAGDFARTLARWLREPGVALTVLFGVIYKLGDAAMAPMVKPFWLDSGLSAETVGLLSTLAGSLLTAFGAVIGGEFTSRVGFLRAVVVLGGLQLVSNLVYAGVALSPTPTGVVCAGMFESLTAGLGTAPLMGLLMRACGREQTATRWATISALTGLSRIVSGVVSGFGTEHFGYAAWFAITAAIAAPALALAPSISRRLDHAG